MVSRVFGISDLHLSGIPPYKPMDELDKKWKDHFVHIEKAWDELVEEDDIVLLPGDLSWAIKLEPDKKKGRPGAIQDLEWIADRPGIKILGKGNHDYWWKSLNKLTNLGLPKTHYIQNNAIVIPERDDLVFVGTRGWMPMNTGNYEAVIERERHRLELSLQEAEENYPDKKKVCLIHFPPVTVNRGRIIAGVLHDTMVNYGVSVCTYGHLHGYRQIARIEGGYGGIDHHFVSCEYLRWTPKLILKD